MFHTFSLFNLRQIPSDEFYRLALASRVTHHHQELQRNYTEFSNTSNQLLSQNKI